MGSNDGQVAMGSLAILDGVTHESRERKTDKKSTIINNKKKKPGRDMARIHKVILYIVNLASDVKSSRSFNTKAV